MLENMKNKMDPETLNKILSAFGEYKIRAKGEPTILSVLGRTYDEDLLSRLVLKCLLDDTEAIAKLLSFCDERLGREGIQKDGISECEGRCEQVTEDLSRVDIYIRGSNALGDRFVLLIENKIGAWEHDEQTKTYARWANLNHGDDMVYCVFLKPSWNKSTCSEKEFVTVDYSTLSGMFSIENRFIDELKLHVAQHLEVNETMDPFIVKHSKTLFEIVREFEKGKIEIAKQINGLVHEKELGGTILIEDHSPGYGVWRYYAKDLHWWDSKYKYYFYIEFKIGVDGDFSKVSVLRTLKTYSKNSRILDTFMAEMNKRPNGYKSEKDNNRYWVRVWDIVPDGDVFSPEWNLSVKEKILKTLKVAFDEQKQIVEEFLKSELYKSGIE